MQNAVIDLEKARPLSAAARAMRAAERGAKPSCLETLRALEAEFRRRSATAELRRT